MANTLLTQEQLRQEIRRVIESVYLKDAGPSLMDSAKLVSRPFSGDVKDLRILEPKNPWRADK